MRNADIVFICVGTPQDKTGAAEHLHRFIGHVRDRLGTEHLGNGGLNIQPLHFFECLEIIIGRGFVQKTEGLIEIVGITIDDRLGQIGLHRAVGQFLPQGLKTGQRFSELLALLDIFASVFDQPLGAPNTTASQFPSADVEHIESNPVPLADFAQHVFDRDFGLLQNERRGGGTVDSQFLFFFAGGDPRKLPFHKKRREFFAVDLGKDRKEIGKTAIGDELLLAV